MDPKTEKLVRRTTMVATITASYFFLTADYGPEPNILDPIKRTIESAETSLKNFIFGSKKESHESGSLHQLLRKSLVSGTISPV